MKIIFPDNIFTRILALSLGDDLRPAVEFLPSSLISRQIEESENSLGLIPTMDLISHKELFISSSFGISFESGLCSSYIYYNSPQRKIDKFNLLGDISSQEVILSKILFKEIYKVNIEIVMVPGANIPKDENALISGNLNFNNDLFLSGISFSEEVIDALSLPYVNYVLASGSESLVRQFNDAAKGAEEKIYNQAEEGNFGDDISESAKEIISSNISSLILNFDEQDREGVNQLLRLPYFYGMIEDMIEVKFV